MKVLHSWLKDYYGDTLPSAAEIERLLTFHSFEIDGMEETGGETVIDVKVLPDRAADALSHRGIAYELAALTGTKLAYDPLPRLGLPIHSKMGCLGATRTPFDTEKTSTLKVEIGDTNHCRRFAAAVVQGVTIGPSPDWLKNRLEALGQRSINNVVDATNYVMLAVGQPTHAYDADKITEKDGVRTLITRMAKDGEHITTLSGEEKTLTSQIQVIADGATGNTLGIAGVKGGAHAAVTDATTTLILEAANFDPQLTRAAAQALKLPTDAAKRFENDLSPEIIPHALMGLVRVVLEVAGGTLQGYADTYPYLDENPEVTVSLAQMNARLGLSLDAATVTDILNRFGFSGTEKDGVWTVMAPFWRRDIHIPEDVIEEVGRVHGYEHVASIAPTPVPLTEINPYHYYGERIRTLLQEAGFSEVITSSFRKKDTIELRNALASDKGCLRSTLRNNITEALDRNMPNADLLGVSRIQLFEIGTVFQETEDGTDVQEHIALGIGARTKQNGHSPKDDARLAEVQGMLESALGASLDARIEGGTLECDLSALIARLPEPLAYEPYVSQDTMAFAPYSTYPFISRDIALWVPHDTSADMLRATITEEAGPLLHSIRLFDTFAKNERVSYAFRLVFQSFERTLTDAEVGEVMERVTAVLKGCGYEVR